MSTEPKTIHEPWTIGRLLSWTHDYLTQNGVDEAKLASEVLLAHSLNCKRIDLFTRFDKEPELSGVDRFRDLVRRAAKHEPIAYLVGEKEFFSLSFTVTNDVLIPRPETETLVEVVMDQSKQAQWNQPYLLEVGTGSGCISIAILTQAELINIVATDISSVALDVAKSNAQRHSVSERITFIEADQLALPEQIIPKDGFHVIMSNPPYVADDDMNSLDQCVRDYEPHIALSDGQDGLSFYRGLAKDSPKLLSSDGLLIVEVADGQAETVEKVIEQSGPLAYRATIKDRVNGMPRVIVFSM